MNQSNKSINSANTSSNNLNSDKLKPVISEIDLDISESCKELISQANKVYFENFDGKTWFGRCIFLSWYCDVGTCKFCYRSTQKSRIKHKENAKRSISSVIVETLLAKKLGWRIEFLTGGYKIFGKDKLIQFAKIVSTIYGEKIWLNLGALSKEDLKLFEPYVSGIVSSIETINEELHNQICPDKAIQPYEDMFEDCTSSDFKEEFKKSMTVVIGLGEKQDHFEELQKFIFKYDLERITFYALKPVLGTPYEKGPATQDYCWWIAKTRIAFPKIEIIAGTTARRVGEVELVLKSGANAITKFPATKQFGTSNAQLLESQISSAGREFVGTLTKFPTDWDYKKEIEELNLVELGLDEELRADIFEKMRIYLDRMKPKQ
ncbi:hypothetical protein HN587_06890 [Candidatus Woesearchaeota archaeon]|jgi:biotin synthase-like enzyme|nr:hypothetical protein [Candidatus Woesearchaeota archaeon]